MTGKDVNPAKGQIVLDCFETPRKWAFTLSDEIKMEKILAERHGKKQSFDLWLGYLVGAITSEDMLTMMWLGCSKYHDGVTEEELADDLKPGGHMAFKAAFVSWATTRYPPGSKKKLEEANEKLLQHLGVDPSTVTRGTKD